MNIAPQSRKQRALSGLDGVLARHPLLCTSGYTDGLHCLPCTNSCYRGQVNGRLRISQDPQTYRMNVGESLRGHQQIPFAHPSIPPQGRRLNMSEVYEAASRAPCCVQRQERY